MIASSSASAGRLTNFAEISLTSTSNDRRSFTARRVASSAVTRSVMSTMDATTNNRESTCDGIQAHFDWKLRAIPTARQQVAARAHLARLLGSC